MRAAIAVELALGVLLWLTFIAGFAGRGRWMDTPAGRQMMVAAVVGCGEMASLCALAFGVTMPTWVYFVGFGLVDVVVARWVWLLWWSRHWPPRGPRKDTLSGT